MATPCAPQGWLQRAVFSERPRRIRCVIKKMLSLTMIWGMPAGVGEGFGPSHVYSDEIRLSCFARLTQRHRETL